jgi:hypothetical protein
VAAGLGLACAARLTPPLPHAACLCVCRADLRLQQRQEDGQRAGQARRRHAAPLQQGRRRVGAAALQHRRRRGRQPCAADPGVHATWGAGPAAAAAPAVPRANLVPGSTPTAASHSPPTIRQPPPARLAARPQEVRDQLMAVVVDMASRGLRCICMAQADIAAAEKGRPADFFETSDHLDQDMTAVAIVGIKDPVRAEVRRWAGPGGCRALPLAGALRAPRCAGRQLQGCVRPERPALSTARPPTCCRAGARRGRHLPEGRHLCAHGHRRQHPHGPPHRARVRHPDRGRHGAGGPHLPDHARGGAAAAAAQAAGAGRPGVCCAAVLGLAARLAARLAAPLHWGRESGCADGSPAPPSPCHPPFTGAGALLARGQARAGVAAQEAGRGGGGDRRRHQRRARAQGVGRRPRHGHRR